MRILFYNWVPFDEKIRGGGVTVYTRNVINALLKKFDDIEVYFLCAGAYYDIENTQIRYERISLNYPVKCKAFSIVNSPVLAPAYVEFPHVKNTFCDRELKKVFCAFLYNEGPFDVIHFQNLEGLSIDALSCKKEFPDTKFIFSLHNYYPFCPRVDLWKANTENCQNITTGEECINCMICHAPRQKLIRKMAMTYDLRKEFSEDKKMKYDAMGRKIDDEYRAEEEKELTDSEKEELTKYLNEYREQFVTLINENMDKVLAVSKRVYDIAFSNGINKNLLKISYIGTEIAEKAVNHYLGDGKLPLNIIYLGYQNAEKGFFFLLEALDALPVEYSKKIGLVIAARGSNFPEEKQKEYKNKFQDFHYQSGYSRDEITTLLSNIDLGIVPVQWEDNLPQVAIEMVACGVPVLSSDRGGASELTNCSDFVFNAGDVNSLVNKIEHFVDFPNELEKYYDNYSGLTTMDKHVNELMEIYSE